jgi:hypothetical protein
MESVCAAQTAAAGALYPRVTVWRTERHTSSIMDTLTPATATTALNRDVLQVVASFLPAFGLVSWVASAMRHASCARTSPGR